MTQPLRSAFDAAAAIILGGAVCFAITSLFQLPLLVAASIGAIVFVRVFASLVRLPVTTPAMALFVPAPLEFSAACDEISRDRELADPALSRVVRLFGPMTAAGGSRDPAGTPPDATDELREAIAQLRRAAG